MKPLKDAMNSFFKKEQSEKMCEKHETPLTIFTVSSKALGSRVTEYCVACHEEKIINENKELAIEAEFKRMKRSTSEVLLKDSIIPDKTLLDATLENYETTEKEQSDNKRLCFQYIDLIKSGQSFNVIMQGNKGAGKSHLSYGMLRKLNESGDVSCLFVSVYEMLRLIRGSFRDKESIYTEDYFVSLLSKVDYLVLDDLGAETGAIDTEQEATNFVQRVLYGVLNARQDKVTIATTNLSSKVLSKMYDEKIISRLLKHRKFVIFRETKDRRTSDLPF